MFGIPYSDATKIVIQRELVDTKYGIRNTCFGVRENEVAMRRCCSLFILIVCVMLLTSCKLMVGNAETCNSNPTIAHEWPSPDGKRKVIESRFDCPGWYAANLDITSPDGSKSRAMDDRPVDQVRPAKWPELKVDWKSANEVWITYPARQDTTCMSKAGEVTVHCLDAAVTR